MRASRLIQFGAALGVPVNYFFNGLEDVGNYPDDLLELFSNRANAELVRLFSEISEPTIRTGLLEMARAACRAQSGNEQPSEELLKKAT
jgi:hypothetical protein